jgi:hypothetical protein
MIDTPAMFAQLATGISAMFGGPYVAGKVIDKGTPVMRGGSIVTPATPTERDCQVQIDKATQQMQAAEGYVSGDMLFIVLAASLDGDLDTDARISVLGGPHAGKWDVSGITKDTMGIGWSGTGRRA